MSPVDPPDLSFWRTVRHLLPLWREQRRLVVLGVTAAFAITALTIEIARLVQEAVDKAIVPKDPGALPPILAAILGLGLLRFCCNFTRRWSTSQIGVKIEARMREMLFGAYLRYPRAFYDRHATGQVLSRATNDLYPVRYFVGWGMVQTIQSAMMIIGVAIVLGTVNLELAVVAGAVMPLVALLTWRFAHLVVPISRQAQQKAADVTESASARPRCAASSCARPTSRRGTCRG
jgi:ABC-type multidrug transport system fused ATPase/permease subunit